MEVVFIKLLNMGIAAGWLILAVIFLRLVLRRAPRRIICLLWGLVAVRLICPVSLQSIFSLIPSRETVRQEIVFSESPAIQSGIRLVDHAVNPILQQAFTPNPGDSANPLQVWLPAAGLLWLLGAGFMLGYAVVSYVRLYLRLRTAVRLDNSVYLSEFVDTPFLFGVLRPRIYLPSGMPEALREQVIAHENAHLARRDHLWKLLAYALLSVYWFHPLCWAAYVLFCRDMELACDERVIRNYDGVQKRAYSEALLEYSVRRSLVGACPLAFGEVGVKARIRSVMNYKKPAFWIIVAAVAGCVLAAVCFLTDPVGKPETGENAENNPQGNREGQNPGEGKENGTSGDSRGEIGGGSNNGENSGIAGGGSIGDNTGADDSNGIRTGQESVGEEEDALLQAFMAEWTEAFVTRDAAGIVGLCGEELLSELELVLPAYASMPENVWGQQKPAGFQGLLWQENGQYRFGEAGAWPRDPEADVVIRALEEDRAEIIYYAWTEALRVIVWKEIISFELREGQYEAVSEELIFYDNISSLRDFSEAYDIYASLDVSGYLMAVDHSRVDYSSNGAGEALGRTAMLSSSMEYRPLFEDPKQAAVMLLNLSEDEELVAITVLESHEQGAASRLGPDRISGDGTAGDGVVNICIDFPREDGLPVRLSMVQYGSGGIWIPVDYRPDPFQRLLDMSWDEIKARNLSVQDDLNWQDIVCIGEIPEKKIKLYGYNDFECSYQGVAIEMGEDVNYFDWSYSSSHNILPECYWNEEKKQLQVAVNIYTGTGADAWALHVLPQSPTGTLQDFVLDLNGYEGLLKQRIDHSFDRDTGRLELYDKQSGELLAVAEVPEDREAASLEMGAISHFILGDEITLQVQVGYCREGTHMAEYEYVNGKVPVLEAELLLEWDDGGGIRFGLGEIRAVR